MRPALVTSPTRRTRSPSRWLVAVSACALCAVASLPATSLLAPPAADASSPTPLIVDTDIFSDADDVGALATAFALQTMGEDQVIAITVNTRLSRPSVATKSWECAAAIAQYYNSPNVPIGADLPDNGSQVGSPDFLTPCAALASPSTPAPASAVSTLRQALVNEPNDSVVIAEIGYEENLEALLASPADSISPLTGAQLVAQKVKTLDIMGGQYPSSPSPENNLAGDPGAAQYVAANWPTKVVYSGAEVGDVVNTGDTIDSAQPVSSPVRAAYDAYAHGGSIPSWDLTAVYHAVRPNDAALTEVGPGQNAIDGSGNDVFTTGTGNQDYLHLANVVGLENSLESLLDVLPSGTSPPPPVPVEISPPSISGATSQGQTLTEIAGSWSNSPTSYTYKWQDCNSSGAQCQTISGATGQTYVLGAGDVGSTIRVLETAHNSGGAGTAATSAATALVTPPVPVDISPPAISGSTGQGLTLTEIAGAWSNNPTSYSYQWQDCNGSGAQCQTISGATGQTYLLTANDVGSTIRVLETAHNSGGAGTAATSAATALVTPQVPVDISPPAISGSTGQGQTLTEVAGSWSNSPTSYSYQWQDCDSSGAQCQTISGATGQTYMLTANDVGSTIRVLETAHNTGGAGIPATSGATAAVIAPASAAGGGSQPTGTGTTLVIPVAHLASSRISSKHRSATFDFKATGGRATGFQCALVREHSGRHGRTPSPKYQHCGSTKTFNHLKVGRYVLYVRAVGAAGEAKRPVTHTFRIA